MTHINILWMNCSKLHLSDSNRDSNLQPLSCAKCWSVWLNGLVFIYELSGCGFESPLLSLKLQIWRLLRTRSSLTFNQTIECSFTLKLVRDMIITYSQLHLMWNKNMVFLLYKLLQAGCRSGFYFMFWKLCIDHQAFMMIRSK